MTARALAEQAALELLEADAGAVAAAAAGRQGLNVQGQQVKAPATTMQRGRTGKVSWDASKHKRGYHGRFAAGGGGQTAEAQRKLHDHGLYSGAIDGQHGPQTKAAVQAYQQRYGISGNGQLNAETVAALQSTPPRTLAQVKAADAKLAATKGRSGTSAAGRAKGAARAAARGGGQTLNTSSPSAVRAFQRQHGLTVDGIAGPQTKAAMQAAGVVSGPSTRGVKGGTGTRASTTRAGGTMRSRKAPRSRIASPQTSITATSAGTPLPLSGVLRQGAGMATNTKGQPKRKRGDAQVRSLQGALQQLGFDVGGGGVDGKLGPQTEKAVKALQAQYGLTVDGVVGRHTKTLINLLLSGGRQPVVQAQVIAALATADAIS